MPRKQRDDQPEPTMVTRRPPATTPERQQAQAIALAQELIMKRLADGSATGQEAIFYARMGSSRETLEQLKLKHEAELLEARTAAMANADKLEELTKEAIRVFTTRYIPQNDDNERP